MKFPELILDESFKGTDLFDNKLKRYKLDWTSIDNYKIESHKKWWKNRTSELSNQYKEAFDKILNNHDWKNYCAPKEYDDIYKMFENFYIPNNYLKEIKHFEELAINEWNKNRSFDTSVRETCLEVSIKSVDLYFYLLMDTNRIFGRHFMSKEHYEKMKIISPLWKYRFWKNQTSRGLVIDRSFYDIHENNEMEKTEMYIKLKSDLEKNIENSDIINNISFEGKSEELVKLIKSYIRKENLEEILNGI